MKMSLKTMISAAAILASGMAFASGPVEYYKTPKPSGTTLGPYELHVTPITDTFSGSSNLTQGICSVNNCVLTAEGTLTDDLTGNTTLTVTDADVGGGGLCGFVTLSGLPWSGSVAHSSLPSPLDEVDFSVGTVQVSSICGSCSGDVAVKFINANGGQFQFSGSVGSSNCTVNGTLESPSFTYVATH